LKFGLLPPAIFLLLNRLHAIECHKRLSTFLKILDLLLEGVKIGLGTGCFPSITIIGGIEIASKA